MNTNFRTDDDRLILDYDRYLHGNRVSNNQHLVIKTAPANLQQQKNHHFLNEDSISDDNSWMTSPHLRSVTEKS